MKIEKWYDLAMTVVKFRYSAVISHFFDKWERFKGQKLRPFLKIDIP